MAKGATCNAYEKVLEPQGANATSSGDGGGGSSTTMSKTGMKPTMSSAGSPSKSGQASTSTGGAEIVGVNLVLAGVLGAAVAMM